MACPMSRSICLSASTTVDPLRLSQDPRKKGRSVGVDSPARQGARSAHTGRNYANNGQRRLAGCTRRPELA